MKVRSVIAGIAAVGLIAVAGVISPVVFVPTAASGPFNFNWNGTPSSPQPWVPGQVNDWDLIATNDVNTDTEGTMQAQHGTDCSSPPATHQIKNLSDAVFICNNHMMTALNGGGDATKTYAAAYFTPSQMVDLSSGIAQITWQVSTQRQAPRDWWDLWLTPFNENEVVPLFGLPAFNGPPKDAIHFLVDNTYCNGSVFQAYGNPSAPWGSIVKEETYTNFQSGAAPTTGACIEDGVGVSATVRASFELDISKSHARLWMPGAGPNVQTLVDTNINFPFNQAVVQWSHHSYNPTKDCPGPCGPNTFHWSNIGITPAVPFTMLRPIQPTSLHTGTVGTLTLPQAAPANSFLRFAALGNISVSLNGATPVPAVRQNQDGPQSDGIIHEEQNSNYWMPIPENTTTVTFSGTGNASTPEWWVQDVSVWSQTALDTTPTPTPSPTQTPTPTPNPTPNPTSSPSPTPTPTLLTPTPTPTATPTPTPSGTPINNVQCAIVMPDGTLQAGTCSGTFTPH